jgi:hypothetical protein
MNKITLLLISFSILFSISCKNNDSEALLPGVKGGTNDVVVVMTEKYWESKPGELLRTRFNMPFPSIPQAEPVFDILHTPHSNFDELYKRQRNLIVVKIGPEHKKGLNIQKNLYAKPQVIISVSAPNQETFATFFLEIQEKIVQIIQNQERKRQMEANFAGLEKSVCKEIQRKHQVNLKIPVGFEISMDSTQFIWLSNEYRNIHEELIIYYYPYDDTNAFTKEALIAKRNEIGKKYIGGTTEGSFMTTEDVYLKYKEFALNEEYAVEMRGLWKLIDGMSMGGPFVSITQYDKKRQRIVTVEGFIFAPGNDKRNLVNRMEAIIYSLEFPDE